MKDPMICFGLSDEQKGTIERFAADPQNGLIRVIVTTDQRMLDHHLRIETQRKCSKVVLYLGDDYNNKAGSRTPRVVQSLLEGSIRPKVQLTVGITPKYGVHFTQAGRLPDKLGFVVTDNPLQALGRQF